MPRMPRWVMSPRARTIALVVAAVFSLTLAISQFALRNDQPGNIQNSLSVLWWLLGLGLVALIPWRHRWPVQIATAFGVGTLALPIDGLLPLIGLYVVWLRRRGRETWAILALSAAAVAMSVWRDSGGDPPAKDGTGGSSFWRTLFPFPAGQSFPWWLQVVIVAILIAATAALAQLGRSRIALQHSEARVDAATAKLDRMGEQMARQQERERLAQEVHDVLGHRLSLLSIHAGALEVAASQTDPRLAESAALVRESAKQSMGDLRSLLSVLREPSDDLRRPVLTLRDLPALIDESLAAGSPVSSSIYVDESAPLDELLSHSAYRITQELLTNARRHAPGVGIRLHIDARPSSGIEISTTNFLPDRRRAPFSPGNGLTGLHERAQQCGGQSWVWVDEQGAFRSLVRIPWAGPGEGVHPGGPR
ncbi:hypothetical protein G9U51_15165 [Calidifontibacter sp. DB0510]|uniref:histidine kinase n=1 Tax=Metallococcus carri TaxID=1656884 RepID=A0A967EBM3_9MICO|nr:histidine kinase [Metallococcus carri]NHN57109.1 hypothetical protein [Metallococcus carri]NOP39022.1 hypothetical protein [Calidifontibacter sp. DB2511S]